MLELAPFGDQAQLSRVDWKEELPDLAAVWGPALKRSPDNACCNNNNNNNACCLKTDLEEGSWQCLFAASKQETLLRQNLTDKKRFLKNSQQYEGNLRCGIFDPWWHSLLDLCRLLKESTVCWNLSNRFIWINWDFTNSQEKKKDYQYLKLNFPNIVSTQVTAPLFQIDFQSFVFRYSWKVPNWW